MAYFEGANAIFEDRSSEIDRFLAFSKAIVCVENPEQHRANRINENILRSNILLMQYNLLESIFLEVFKEFYETMKNTSITIDNMSPQFSYNFYLLLRRSPSKTSEKVKMKLFGRDLARNFSYSAISSCFDLDDEEQKFLVNGNLDGRKIKDFLSEWGIDISILEEQDVSCLKTLKDQRQLLAHGGQSFSAIGRNATWEDIDSHKTAIDTLFNETKSLLSSFLNQLT